MASLKIAESHNVSIILGEPPMGHEYFKSMMVRLRECCISTTLTWNPIIYMDLINEFWRSARVLNGDNGMQSIEAKVQGHRIVISEQFIRDTLNNDDKTAYPTTVDLRTVDDYLEKLGYEGDFPPTIKKLLPPHWRF